MASLLHFGACWHPLMKLKQSSTSFWWLQKVPYGRNASTHMLLPSVRSHFSYGVVPNGLSSRKNKDN
eukprot:scaffold24426_cov54-Attheya_sp.AAC.3